MIGNAPSDMTPTAIRAFGTLGGNCGCCVTIGSASAQRATSSGARLEGR
ncbi:hypothetical protein LV780_19415 (plasmid) [Cereibacter azotoformans]|nr:hypothetical protein [Cereibacter azotoformans]UIJ33011.1 hypothetical protein LV780_19415 [Cereibacter azotoformans]